MPQPWALIEGERNYGGKKSKNYRETRKKAGLTNEHGFTLLEVIIAISILSIGLLGVASMQVASIRANALASNVTEGVTVASSRLEKLLASPYTNSDLSAGNHTDPNPPSGYSVSWNVTDDFPAKNTKKISLSVTWIDHGVQKRVTMHRIKARMI